MRLLEQLAPEPLIPHGASANAGKKTKKRTSSQRNDKENEEPTVRAARRNDAQPTTGDTLPGWLADAREYLQTVFEDERWQDLVRKWLGFEGALGYPDG